MCRINLLLIFKTQIMTLIIRRIYRFLLLSIGISFINKATLGQRVLTLDQCRMLAMERNNMLKAAQANIDAAEAFRMQQDAGGKPVVDLTVAGFYFGKPLNAVLPEYGAGPDLGLKQPLYAGGRIRLYKAAAGKGLEILEEQKVLTTAELLFRTEKAYWEVVLAGEQIRLAEQTKKQLDALYTNLDNQYQAGIIYKNDVLRAKVQQTQNELRLTRARDALTFTKLNLAQITGLPDGAEFNIADSVIGIFNAPQNNSDIQEAVSRRSEIKILQKSIESEKLTKEILKAELKPSLNMGLDGLAAWGKQGINPSNNGNFIASYYGVISLSLPIFDGGRKRQKIQEQQFRIAAQEYQLKERQEQVLLEIQQAYLQLNQSVKHIELSRLSLEQAEENLKLSNDRLKAGTIVASDALDAQTIWQQAYSNFIEAKVEYRINESALKRALGELK
jgi:outer membrane protein TolC